MNKSSEGWETGPPFSVFFIFNSEGVVKWQSQKRSKYSN